MIVNRKSIDRFAVLGTLALLSVNIAFLFWYLFYGYRLDFNSDSAVKVLLAREIFETSDYFPNDWNYVNKDLFVLFGHTFIVPQLAIISAGYLAHAISGLISSIFILLGVWLVSGLAPLSMARRLAIVSVVAAGISGFVAENLYGQVSYGTVLYFTCYILFFSWKYMSAHRGWKWAWGVLLFVAVWLAFWANPQRALVSYGLPLAAAVLILRFRFYYLFDDSQRKNILFILGIVFMGAMIGAWLHAQTITGVNNFAGAGHARWLSYELMARNFSYFLKGFLAIFGGLPSAEGVVVSKYGIYEAARLIAALGIVILVPIAVIRTLRQGDSGSIFICIYAVVAFMLVLFLQLTTTIPDMNDPITSSRYLVPSLILLLLLLLMQPINFSKQLVSGVLTVFIFVMLTTGAYLAFVLAGQNSALNWGMAGARISRHQGVAESLANNGLRYGYATYWNAGSTSVLSDERVLVRQIVIDAGVPMPMRHLSSDRWYRPGAFQGETFLLLTLQEAKLLDQERLASLGIKAIREFTFSDFKVFVFSENIAKNLPGWDFKYEAAANFLANKHSLSQIGRFVKDFDLAGSALVAEKGEAGALHFGPYVNVEPGRYVVTFDVLAAHNDAGAIRLDVAAPDQKLYGEKHLNDSSKPQQIIITVDKAQTMEFRVWALGNERVVFKGVAIKRLPEST